MTQKLGLPKYNKELISKLLNNLAVDKVDYTNFFRSLSNVKADPTIGEGFLLEPFKGVLLNIEDERREAWTSWIKVYISEVCFREISHDNSYIIFLYFRSMIIHDLPRGVLSADFLWDSG